MGLKILVFVKQVPDTQNISGSAMTPEGTVNRAALPAIFNPEDLNALELALQLKDRYNAEVTVATMGMPAAAEVLRQSLYRGADRAVLVTDRALAGADTLATSYTLSCCAKKVGAVDLILCGRQAIDGDTAQTGPQIAEKLNIPQLCYVEEVKDIADGKITLRRAIEGGYEILESPMPALLTVIDCNLPRPVNVKSMMKNKRAKTASEIKAAFKDDPAAADAEMAKLAAKGLLIEEWSAADIEADPQRIGFAGSPTKVKQVQSVILTAGDAKSVAPTADAIAELMHELISDHTLG
ncbi:MAG: electron transfer flavoprotein subunit beta/FixA family protein [Lentisphaeria bacterium]|nr:electron transfer flavoprotein subunit beta/FixA family protein [Lentisphaeria bacterium]MBR7118832.1 electron transfer flavoprotein subunit beta/FixA family protein [Lentisphaeria bacterium]